MIANIFGAHFANFQVEILGFGESWSTYNSPHIDILFDIFNIKLVSVNSLWPSDAIRRQETESALAQVMACCLTASSHYLNHVDLSSVRCCGIHQRALSREDLKIPISKTRLKITFLESHLDLPGANELNLGIRWIWYSIRRWQSHVSFLSFYMNSSFPQMFCNCMLYIVCCFHTGNPCYIQVIKNIFPHTW